MPWNHSSEATLNASRTRKAAPTKRELQAESYRGVLLIERGGKIHLYETSGPYGSRWLAPRYSRAEAIRAVDQMLGTVR